MSISFVYPLYLWFLFLIPLTVVLALFGRQKSARRRFWIGLIVRCLLLLLIILALAGIQLYLPSKELTAVFVMDYSDSISAMERARGEDIIRQSIATMPEGDQAAVVIFGEDALVERLAEEDNHLAELSSVPVSTRTDIFSAMQLAMALFPNEGSKRLVLLSDGRENIRQAVRQAEVAAMQNIELVYIPLGDQKPEGEVLVEALNVPTEVRFGQDFDLEVSIQSTLDTIADLQVFADSSLIYHREVNLQTGMNRYRVTIEKEETGFHRYRAIIVPDQDRQLLNNEASAFTQVQGAASVLIVEGSLGEAQNLEQALISAEMQVETISPEQMPALLEELARYDVIALVNVPISDLPAGALQALPVYVRDLGHGLLTVGGDHAYGAGGYLRTDLEAVLPVNMEVTSKDRKRNLALVVAVDKSGSMGRCHCDSSDLNQTYTRQEVGQPKVDIAKEAIMRSANALGSQDYLGVVGFDSQAHWALQITQLPELSVIENSIGTITANGQTNLQAGISAAFDALVNVDAGRKHVILLTDGWSNSGDISGLIYKMNEAGITVSLVAAGGGSADYLRSLAEAGGGRYYAAKDMLSVPDIFLQETVQSVGEYIIEEPFYPLPGNPSPILRGLDEGLLPPLQGYNGTTVKRTARLDLLTPRGDPLLSSWQYGLGKAAAWTSDLKGQWAIDWLHWDNFSRFSAQLIGYLLPANRTEGLTVQTEVQDQGVLLRMLAEDEQGHSLNNLDVKARVIDPDLEIQEISLKQVSAGEYEILSALDKPGTYLITFSASDDIVPVGQATIGLVVPYSPEYRSGGLNLALLEHLAQITGGGELVEPTKVFLHDLYSKPNAAEIWHTLLLMVALLFPLDVTLRRLSLTRRDWQEFYQHIQQPFIKLKASNVGQAPRILGALFEARQRARQPKQESARDVHLSMSMDVPTSQNVSENRGSENGSSSKDAIQRLQAAKRRARGKNG